MNTKGQNKETTPPRVSTLNTMTPSTLQKAQLDLLDNIDDIKFEINVYGSHLESPTSTKNLLPRTPFKEAQTENRHEPLENSNGTNNSMSTVPGSTSIDGRPLNNIENVMLQLYNNEINPSISHNNIPGNNPLKQSYNEQYGELGLGETMFKGEESLESSEKKGNEQTGNIYLGQECHIVPEDSASQTQPVLHKKRGRKPGQKVKPRKKKGEDDDEEYKVEEDEENEEEGRDRLDRFAQMELEEDEESNRGNKQDREGFLGRGNTNERKEYTAYEDWKILEATEDYIEKNGAKGLQSITMWQQLKDPATGDLVLKGVRSFESMRDRYKRYIMLLNKEDKQKLREFIQTHTEEEQRTHHCLFKKVNKRRKFIGISTQLNYDPDRIKRRTPYNTKFAKTRMEKRRLEVLMNDQVPKKKRGRKKKLIQEEMKGRVEMGFDTGKEDDTEINNNHNFQVVQGDNYLEEEDISNFNESQLLLHHNRHDMFTYQENSKGASHIGDEEFRLLKALKGNKGPKGENSTSKESFETGFFQNESRSNLGKRQMPVGYVGDFMEKGAFPSKKVCKEEAQVTSKPKRGRGRSKRSDSVLINDQNSMEFLQENNEYSFGKDRGHVMEKREELGQYGRYNNNGGFQDYRENPQQGFLDEEGRVYQRYSDMFGAKKPTDMIGNDKEPAHYYNSGYRRGFQQHISLKDIRFEEEIRAGEYHATDAFSKKGPPEQYTIKDIKILADYSVKSRQFVEVYNDQMHVAPPSLNELAKRYGISMDQILGYYYALSCNLQDLEEMLRTENKTLLWTPEEDESLMRNRAVPFLKAIKGENKVKERKKYLMQRD